MGPQTPHQSQGSDQLFPLRWRSLLAFAFATIVDDSEKNLINGLFPTIRQALGLSLVHLSLLTNISKIISAILGPAWAMAADRYNRKRILVTVTGLWGFWTFAAGFSQNFAQLVTLYIIASLGSVASIPIIMAAISDLFPDKNRGVAMGIFGAASVILGALATLAFSGLADLALWRYGYFITGGFSLLSGALIWFAFEDPGRGASESGMTIEKQRSPASLADFTRLFNIPSLVILFFQKILNAGLLVWSFGTVYMVDVFGFTNREALLTTAIPLLFGNIFGNLLGGFLGDRVNQRYPNTGRIALMQVTFFGSAVMSYLCMQIHWGIKSTFYLVFFIWGIFLSFGTGIDRPMVAAVTPPELRSTAFGIWMSSGDALASIIMASLAGWLGQVYGLQPVFLWLVTGGLSLRSLVWFSLYRPYPRDIHRFSRAVGPDADLVG
jgi:MFS family permease